MSGSEQVRAWRERLRKAGKVPVTLWLDAETQARLEDLALHQRRSPSDLAQEALDAHHPGSTQVSATLTDLQQIQALVQQELTQGTETFTALVTGKVTDIVTTTITARLPALVQETVQAALAAQPPPRRPARQRHSDPLSVTDTVTVPDTATPAPTDTKAALVVRLRTLRAEGKSLAQIAAQLQAEGVPTLSRKGEWQKGTVGKLLRGS